MSDEVVFKINDVPMPIPSKGGFSVKISDADGEGSGRNAKMYVRRQRIRKGIRAIDVSYTFIDQATSKKILDALEPEFINVTYRDPQLGVTTKRMYVGDRTVPAYGRTIHGVFKWEKLSFTLVEQ